MSSNDETDDQDSHSKVAIREMEIGDLAGVYELGASLFTRARRPTLYRTWDPYEVTYYFNADSDFCLVAEEEDTGDLVGFALGATVEKDGTAWRYGYLAWVAVKPEYQGTQVAARLLREFEKRMREEGVRLLLVDTEADNQQALRFFQKHGFRQPTSHLWLTKSLGKRVRATKSPSAGLTRRMARGHRTLRSKPRNRVP